jgi:hypothetical protein
MKRHVRIASIGLLLAAAGDGAPRAEPDAQAVAVADAVSNASSRPEAPVAPETAADRARRARPAGEDGGSKLNHLVPELTGNPYKLAPGPRTFARRLAFSPGYGVLGDQTLYALRLAYNPSEWLGYEASLGHNPGKSVHAALHMLNAIARCPLPWRAQPYVAVGYGMMMVFPGRSLNADPVTKNAVAIGGGFEFYIRNDLAVRTETRWVTVLGHERDHPGTVAYDYAEATVGLTFYRTLAE